MSLLSYKDSKCNICERLNNPHPLISITSGGNPRGPAERTLFFHLVRRFWTSDSIQAVFASESSSPKSVFALRRTLWRISCSFPSGGRCVRRRWLCIVGLWKNDTYFFQEVHCACEFHDADFLVALDFHWVRDFRRRLRFGLPIPSCSSASFSYCQGKYGHYCPSNHRSGCLCAVAGLWVTQATRLTYFCKSSTN